MGRGGGGCALCTPVKTRHRGRQHRDNPVQWCENEACRAHVCEKHIKWVGGKWLCARCVRQDQKAG